MTLPEEGRSGYAFSTMKPCATTLEAELTPEELDFLFETMRRAHLPGKHLEIGTAAGGTLWRMMRCYDDGERPPFVVVDPMTYFPNQLERVRENLQLNGVDPDSVDFRVMTSDRAFEAAEKGGEGFDFIFIDAIHKIRQVTRDLRWARLLNQRGVLAMHDYSREFPGVWVAANRFQAKNPHYVRLGLERSLLVMQKSVASRVPEVSAVDRFLAEVLAPCLQLKVSLRKRWRRWKPGAKKATAPFS